jgi:hypothetical protein
LTQNTSLLAFMHSKVYLGLWVSQRLVLLAFWVTAAYSSTQVFRERAYDPDYLLGMS